MSRVGIVVIGRNEGERLRRCLKSLVPEGAPIIYVDSGSTDGSVAYARGLGLQVLELDPSKPFTAARGRNEGFEALTAMQEVDYVQFVDGDCEVEPGWIEMAQQTLDGDSGLGIVTGWLSEVDPKRNIYHAISQTEWHLPTGDITACGGIMMVRVTAFRSSGPFDTRLVAGEDDEFCLRLSARTGLRVHRIARIMARHDMDMSELAQWWRRSVRAGHVFAQMRLFHPTHFRRERVRAWIYGLVLPLAALLGTATGTWWMVGLVVLVYGASWLRTADGLRRAQNLRWSLALHQAAYLALSKLPNVQGMLTYHVRSRRPGGLRIIEHK